MDKIYKQIKWQGTPSNPKTQGGKNKLIAIVASVWVIAERVRKLYERPANMRPQNSQPVFPGKYHTPIREQ